MLLRKPLATAKPAASSPEEFDAKNGCEPRDGASLKVMFTRRFCWAVKRGYIGLKRIRHVKTLILNVFGCPPNPLCFRFCGAYHVARFSEILWLQAKKSGSSRIRTLCALVWDQR